MAIKLSQITDRIMARFDIEGNQNIQPQQIWSIIHAELKDLYVAQLPYTTFYGQMEVLSIEEVDYPPGVSPAIYTQYEVDLSSKNYSKVSKVMNIDTGKPLPKTPTEADLDGWANSSQHENDIFYFEYGRKLIFRKGLEVEEFPNRVFVWYHRLPTEAIADNKDIDAPDEWEAPLIDNAIKHVYRKSNKRDISVDVSKDAAESIANLRAASQEQMLLMEGAKKAK